jgi:hypothetical protein
VTRTTKTNSDGLYSFPALAAGAYDLKAQSTGFAAATRTGINLVTDTTLTMDFQLAVAGTAQDVQVTEEAPMVETTQSHLSSNLQHAEVQELPMLNRSVSSLIALNPGVREETTNMNVPGTSTTHTYFNVGGNGRNSMELVDGRNSTSWRTALRRNTEGPAAESPAW